MTLVEVSHLTKWFTRGSGLFSGGSTVTAVNDVSFSIEAGETFGLVGESGCGKTTTGRCLLRLIEPTSGAVRFDGRDVLALSAQELRLARRDMQIVFQDPLASLNPRMRARVIVEEPLVIHGLGTRSERRERVAELFTLVGLDVAHLERYPHQFSGGQRQRIGLARALALNPRFVVLDEAVSALDVSVQAQVINLLLDLQARLDLTYLFIAHDLRVVEHICQRVAVMFRGRIVEMGPTGAVFGTPFHPYTRRLLAAVPRIADDRGTAAAESGPEQTLRGLSDRERHDRAPSHGARSEQATAEAFDESAPLVVVGEHHYAAIGDMSNF